MALRKPHSKYMFQLVSPRLSLSWKAFGDSLCFAQDPEHSRVYMNSYSYLSVNPLKWRTKFLILFIFVRFRYSFVLLIFQTRSVAKLRLDLQISDNFVFSLKIQIRCISFRWILKTTTYPICWTKPACSTYIYQFPIYRYHTR